MKLYYLFLLLMFFLMEGCTNKPNYHDSYSDKYEYKVKRDSVKHKRHNDYYYMNNHTYSNNSGISSSPYSSSYKKKSYSGSRRSHSTRTRSHRR